MGKRLIIIAVAVLVLAVAGATAVMAQEPTTTPTPGFGLFGRWADEFGLMRSQNGFGLMRGRGNFGPMNDENGFGPMRGRGGNFGPMNDENGFGPMRGRGGNFGPMGGRGMWGGAGNSLMPVVAEQLGLTLEELLSELQAGKTIAELAQAQEVELQTIVDAVLAPRSERLAQAVENGRLTQEQADELLATLETNITTRLNQSWSDWSHGPGFVDEDGDGVSDHKGRFGRGNRAGFVDEDGNGICDHMEAINQDSQAE